MKGLKSVANGLHKVSSVCVWISGLTLFGIALFIFIDVFARYIFNSPITGSQEICELAILVVLYMGLPFSTYSRSHVRVDALTSHFSPKAKAICLGIMTLACILVSGPIAVQMFRQGLRVIAHGNASVLLKIPHAPFYFLASFGNVLLSFEFLADGIRYFVEAGQDGKRTEEMLDTTEKEGNV